MREAKIDRVVIADWPKIAPVFRNVSNRTTLQNNNWYFQNYSRNDYKRHLWSARRPRQVRCSARIRRGRHMLYVFAA